MGIDLKLSPRAYGAIQGEVRGDGPPCSYESDGGTPVRAAIRLARSRLNRHAGSRGVITPRDEPDPQKVRFGALVPGIKHLHHRLRLVPIAPALASFFMPVGTL